MARTSSLVPSDTVYARTRKQREADLARAAKHLADAAALLDKLHAEGTERAYAMSESQRTAHTCLARAAVRADEAVTYMRDCFTA